MKGLVVVEVGEGVSSAIAGMLMADFGAEVVRLPGPTRRADDPGLLMWHRNKRVFGHNLGDDELSTVRRLLESADICIIGPDRQVLRDALPQLTEEYPQVVFLDLPPYAGTAPWGSHAAGSELLAATMGLAMRQSSIEDGPVHSVYPHISYIHGVWAATCAVAALIERAGSGRGQTVTVTGVHASLLTGMATFVIDPVTTQQVMPAGPGGPHPLYTTYRCGDGEWLFLGGLTEKFQRRALEVLGAQHIASDPRLGGVIDHAVLPENRDWVRAVLAQRFQTQRREHWLSHLEKADCPAGPVGDRDKWLDSEQIREIGMRVVVRDPGGGVLVMPGIPLTFTRGAGQVRSLERIVIDPAEVDPSDDRPVRSRPEAATATSGPLAGFRMLDLGTVLAGPLGGSLLAELGADVVKVEPLAGDPFRVRGFVYNRGMRSVAIDLRAPAGQRSFHRLVMQSDAVIDNFRPGVLDRLGIDYQSLASVNPQIVCFSLTGFGVRGPLRDNPGFDPILQAMSGMMSAQGGRGDPVFYTVAVNDICGGALGALAVCLGILHRLRDGEGQSITSSLAAISVFMQSGELVQVDGRAPAPTGGPDYRGPSPLNRYYPGRDGWLRVETCNYEEDLRRIAEALGVNGEDASRVEDALAGRTATSAVDDTVAWLVRLGISATSARRPQDLLEDESLMNRDVFHKHARRDGRPYFTPGRLASFGRTQQTRRLVPPGLGKHTEELLLESGLSAGQVDELKDDRAVLAGGAPFVVEELVAYR
jgi:crotonobetainyl-CoA:carnitine CoA-transferase CaiB-like acyl-CoA transferase